MQLEVELAILLVFDRKDRFSAKIFLSIGVDDSELAWLKQRILHVDTQQQQVRQLHDMDRTDATFSEKIRPVLLSVLIIDPVFEVIW